jgi:hypothetical protein
MAAFFLQTDVVSGTEQPHAEAKLLPYQCQEFFTYP